ncbi:hypothetical protein E1B28_010631 [Marasmius oreades]|uniref:BTB domain-containing protein n=1 Tax=Marasmius oreades TaxID=181124 RepID=A0A9P7RY69_9AGAR|nr:uncharacterized protein E1B28_010631 [Marasmius oreades]KAG7091612.1 hypothetical protein E1B28_010631 [Marasmius oreades]
MPSLEQLIDDNTLPDDGEAWDCPCKGCTIPVDITLQSSDGIHFGAHKKNLEYFSEGFPPVEWTDEKTDEIVELSEKEIVLELLLRFMHNAALPILSKECSGWNINDLLAFIDAVEKYGVFIALQAGDEALRSRASELSAEELLKVLLRKAARSDSSDIDVFARQSLKIPMMVGLNILEAHPRIFMIWCRYQLEWKEWKDEYHQEMFKMRRCHRNVNDEDCKVLRNYLNVFHPIIRKIGGEFPDLHHFEQAVNLLSSIPTVGKFCQLQCSSFKNWRDAFRELFRKQKRWVDCISVSGSN